MAINQKHTLLTDFCRDISFTGDIARDSAALLVQHRCPETVHHSRQVANEARRIARCAGIDSKQAEIAGLLHDISTVFPVEERATIARMLDIEVLEEEDRCPMIVHQKISRLMALEIFDVTDEVTLDAIGCHTTLRAHATPLDKVLFVADKIAWDQEGIPPYDAALRVALELSFDHAARFFVNYLWEHRQSLLVLHPWLCEAYQDFSRK